MNTVIEYLNAWGGSFVQFARPTLLQSAVVIAVVLGLNWALRRHVRAVVRYALLLLILVKLVLPPSFALPTGAGNWIGVDRSLLAQAPEEVSAAPKALTPAEPVVPMIDVDLLAPPTSNPQPARAILSWRAVLFLGWVAGMIVLLGLVVRRFRSVGRLVARAEEAPAELQQVLEFCRAKLAVRQPVVLRFSAFPSSPAVCGLRRPVILVPKALAESFSAEQLEAVLLHELGHIKRGDLWVSHLQTLLQIFYWYNPMLWAANAAIRRVREEAVDELVMVTMKSQAGTYPGTLLAVAKLGFMQRLAGLGLVGIAESNRGLKERLQKLVSRPIPKKAKLGVFGVLIVALVALVILPLANGAKYAAPEIALRIVRTTVQVPAPQYDLSADFSLAANPHGPWSYGALKTLADELQTLGAMRKGLDTPADQVEAYGKALLEKYADPGQRALIHYQLAFIHDQSGLKRPDLVESHSEAALGLPPLDVARRLQLYIFLGDAKQTMNRVLSERDKLPFPKMRTETTHVCLQGLKESAKYNIPEIKPELPSMPPIERVMGDPNDPEIERRLVRLQKENEEYERKRDEVRQLQEAWDYRRILYDKIVDLYLRQPAADDEMRELAVHALPDAMVRILLGRFEEKAGLRQPIIGTPTTL